MLRWIRLAWSVIKGPKDDKFFGDMIGNSRGVIRFLKETGYASSKKVD